MNYLRRQGFSPPPFVDMFPTHANVIMLFSLTFGQSPSPLFVNVVYGCPLRATQLQLSARTELDLISTDVLFVFDFVVCGYLIINSNSVSLHKCLLPLRLETIGRFAIFLLQIHFYAFCDGF